MEFQIDFNRESRDDVLEKIAYKRDDFYYVDLPDFEAMQKLWKKVERVAGGYYSFVVDFDHPTIFLDKSI
jgi:hypothetical protein